MKKWIIIGGLVVVAIIVVALFVGISNLGPMIKSAVNTYGPKITKTDVKLGDVGLSIFSGQAKLKDFFLGNPEGFKAKEAMRVKSVYVDVDEKSIPKDTIVIDRIEVVRPEITYEKARGTDNFKTILDNIQESVGGGGPAKKKTGKEGEGKKILIRDFIVKGGKVNLAVSMLAGKSVSAELPDIHLRDVGKKKKGATPAEAFEEILAVLYEKITSPSVVGALDKKLKALGTSFQALGKGTKQIEALGKEAQKKIETLKKEPQKGLEKLGKGSGEDVESVTKKVKGLLGK